MAILAGGVIESAAGVDNIPSGLTASYLKVDLYDRSVTAVEANMPYGLKDYSDTGVYPAGSTLNGDRMLSFIDSFYNRIHVIPSDIAFGNLVSTVERSISIWNSFFENKTLSSINAANTGGLQIDGLPSLPNVYQPLEYNTYTLIASTDGPGIIDARYEFVFAHGESPRLNITGRRIIVFPFRPNWQDQFTENLEWLTNILRSHDGTEQRRALRIKPRRSFEFNINLKDTALRLLETVLWGWQTRNFAVPVWSDKTQLNSDVVAGAVNLAVNTDTYGFSSGGTVILYRDYDDYEAAVVGSFTSSTLTLAFPVQRNWPAGTKVYPMVIAHLPTSVAMQRYTDRLATSKITFNASPDDTYPNLPVITPAVTYDGLEVITRATNWKEPISNEFSHAFDTIDFGVGAVAYMVTETSPRITRPFVWLLKNREDIVDFRALILRLRGQAKTVWIPSWHDDMTLADAVSASAPSMVISGIDFASLIGVDTSRDRLMITLKSGQVFYRKITTITEQVGTTLLGLNTSFGIVIDPANVKKIQFLLRCRLATDKVTIPWRTDSVANPQLVFTTTPL